MTLTDQTATDRPDASSPEAGPAAVVVADSVSGQGKRLTTMVVTFARSALAEFNTHRVFSRNSASSRAIPVERLLAYAQADPFIPRRFSLNKPGMNAHAFLEPGEPGWDDAVSWWLAARDHAIASVRRGIELGIHKQDANRLLEPFLRHTVVVSATEWQNFFDQRLALDAAGFPLAYLPIYDAALAMREALDASVPREVAPGGWHLPFVTDDERAAHPLDVCQRVATARCARVTYYTADGDRRIGAGRSVDDDLTLYERLASPAPGAAPHLSPFEHVATPADGATPGNFDGWAQLRHQLFGR